jgi:hypothetical protein
MIELDELRKIQERMAALDNHALQRLVAVEQSDYRPEVLNIAHGELRRRGLEILDKEQYWERFPLERVGPDGFCTRCRSQTTDESPGNAYSVNFVGTKLIGGPDPYQCPACGSIVQTKWFWFFVPIVPLGSYRIIYLEKEMFSSRYVGRKLRKGQKLRQQLGSAL